MRAPLMKYHSILLASMIFSLVFGGLFFNNTVSAKHVDSSCQKVEAVFARGSGQPLNDQEYGRFNRDLVNYFGNDAHTYELGIESYGGAQYPAVGVGFEHPINSLGAYATFGHGYSYGDSVAKGAQEMTAYLSQRLSKCKTSYFILGGYSQGAQVIGETLYFLKQDRQRVVFVALFGDPKLNLPEGIGFNPPACSNQKLSLYRRDIGNCDTDKGSLGARAPYLPDDFSSKTGLWCNAHDYVCGSTIAIWDTEGHGKYADHGAAIDKGVREAADRLRPFVSMNDQVANSNNAIPLKNSDRVYVIDPGRLDQFALDDLKNQVLGIAQNTYLNGGRISLVESYKSGFSSSSYEILSKFNSGLSGFESGLDKITPIDDWQVTNTYDVYQVLRNNIRDTPWSQHNRKVVTYITGGAMSRPNFDDFDHDAMIKVVLDQASQSGGVVISARVSRLLDGGSFEDFAQRTNGTFYDNTPDISLGRMAGPTVNTGDSWVDQTIHNDEMRPSVQLDLDTYYGAPGESVHFELSASSPGTIVKYQWDFDGDYEFDETTTVPYVDHVYAGEFDGRINARAITDEDIGGQASAAVIIAARQQYIRPVSPSNLKLTVLSTKDSISTAKLTWNVSASPPAYYILKLNGVPLGSLTNDRTSINLTEIDRSIDNEVALMSVSADGIVGEDNSLLLGALDGAKQNAVGRGSAAMADNVLTEESDNQKLENVTRSNLVSTAAEIKRSSHQRNDLMLIVSLMIIGAAAIGVVGYGIYRRYSTKL